MDQMPPLIPDALLEEVAITGSPNEIPRKLRERYEGILDRVSLYFPFPPMLRRRSGEDLSEHFMPRLKPCLLIVNP